MADSFFGFDTSVSNINEDEGGGGPSEDEYDALNDETFGQDGDFDWEVEHEQFSEQMESSRRQTSGIDDSADSQLEASLSQLVLDETDAPQSRTLGSSVWRHDAPFPAAPTPMQSAIKNVCTVEQLERQLRQNQMQQPSQSFNPQNYYQPRFPLILQRPPGLQPQPSVGLPFNHQQTMTPNMPQMNQPLNKIVGQNTQMAQMSQNNQLLPNQMTQNINQIGPNMNQMSLNVNQLGQNMNQMVNNQLGHNMTQIQNVSLNQSVNQMGPSVTQFMQNSNLMTNHFQNNQMQQTMMNQIPQNIHQMSQANNILQSQMSQNVNQMGQNFNQMGQNVNQLGQNKIGQNVNQNKNQVGQNMNPGGQNMNQVGQSLNQVGQNMNLVTQNMNQVGQNMNQVGQNMNQVGQNMNQVGQNMNQVGQKINQISQNQMMPNGNQFGPGMNQFGPMMGQPRMMPPPGLNINTRPNFNQNMGQFNPNFRAQSVPTKTEPTPINQPVNQIQPKPNLSPPKNQNRVENDRKLQKSRVYNNKTLTSQNLVEIIQNTHPMLQYNSFHNASHHPMLNRNMFNQANHPLLYQRPNGVYNNSRSLMNGDDIDGSVSSDTDEYAGLMTAREKQWLINIQILQLNTGTPYIHDFYYTVFLERQMKKEKEGVKEAHKANQQNHPFYSGVNKPESQPRERHNSGRHNSCSEEPARVYVPAQFENSLGKLQCGSVTAPRKIIDLEVVSNEATPPRNERAVSRASTTNASEVPREVKRTKQILLDIESLYLILLRIEELNDPLAISNAIILKEREEKQRQLEAAQKDAENEDEDSNLFLKNIESVQRRPKQDSPKSETIDKRQVVNLVVCQKPPVKNLLDENKDDLINKMFAGLLHGDRLIQMMTVRKGRGLLVRFLRRVGGSHPRLRALWSRVLRGVSAAARRDDGALEMLAPQFTKYIYATSGWTAILESCSLLSEAFDPARTPYALTTAFTLSCVCDLIEKASILVNTPEATSNERQWYKFLKTLARALKNTTLKVAKPLRPLPEAKLLHHMKQLESRSTIEILQRGKTTTEFADIPKSEVTGQLVKHLC